LSYGVDSSEEPSERLTYYKFQKKHYSGKYKKTGLKK